MNPARFFPLKQRRRRPLTLRSELGEIELVVDYGQKPGSDRWGCPIREQWQLGPHEKLTPGFAEKLYVRLGDPRQSGVTATFRFQ